MARKYRNPGTRSETRYFIRRFLAKPKNTSAGASFLGSFLDAQKGAKEKNVKRIIDLDLHFYNWM
ncbi:MAG: hypothetical protein HKN00_05190 [Flavobacteriaceae bacterium]|nr:hypothetical protein [Flavobacteriaceae bacterium]